MSKSEQRRNSGRVFKTLDDFLGDLAELFFLAGIAEVTCNSYNKRMKTSVAGRVGKHRAALRAAGLRPVQIWVPDTRSRRFRAAARRQSLMLKDDPHEAEILNWIAKVSDHSGWK